MRPGFGLSDVDQEGVCDSRIAPARKIQLKGTPNGYHGRRRRDPEARNYSVRHIDPAHRLAEFSVRHMMVTNVRGRFTGISGTIVDAGEDPIYSSVKSAIDVTTLVTGDPQRDEHLRSPDFFDVTRYPSISFGSRKISGSRGKFTVTGDLTIHGVTREVLLDVTFNRTGTNPLGKTVAGFTAETKINRQGLRSELEHGARGGRIPCGR